MSEAAPSRGSRPTRAGCFRIPAERKGVPAQHGPHRERDRQVQHHDEPGGERAIVHAGPVAHRDGHLAHHLAIRADHHVAHAVPHAAVVGDGVVLAGERVQVRMAAERSGERAAERVVALLLERGRQLDRVAAGLDEGERPTAEGHDVGVDGVVAPVPRARRGLAAERRRGQAGADPAVAVARRSVAQRHRVHHAVAEEPVVRRWVGADRIGAHLEVAAPEPGRDRAAHRQGVERHLLAHRPVHADEELARARPPPPAVNGGDPGDAALGQRPDHPLGRAGHQRPSLPAGLALPSLARRT